MPQRLEIAEGFVEVKGMLCAVAAGVTSDLVLAQIPEIVVVIVIDV